MIVYHGRSREQDRDSLFETWDEKESSCSRSSTLIDAHCVCLLHYAMWLLSSCCSSWLHRPVSRGHIARHSRTQGYLMDGKKQFVSFPHQRRTEILRYIAFWRTQSQPVQCLQLTSVKLLEIWRTITLVRGNSHEQIRNSSKCKEQPSKW